MRLVPILLAALVAAPSLALAQAPAPEGAAPQAAAPVTAAPAPRAAPVEEPYPQFGLALAVGAPDGAVLSFTWSPLYWLLVDAGFAYTLAPGMVFGLEFRPIDFFISPIIRGEYGYYFAGNTANQIKKWVGLPEASWPLIGDASYNWFSGLIGFALGSRRGFTAALEGGVGYLSLNVKGGTATSGGLSISTEAYKVTSFMPVARLSFLYFF
ncbi:MAG: hypothetical protein WCS72_02525 [Deltaproteobacteria bacterium]